jgi:hypothetical protein
MLVDAGGGLIFALRPERVLDELRELHRMAPRATIEVLELDEVVPLDSVGRGTMPAWTPVGWIWRPRLHRLAKGAASARADVQLRRSRPR